MLNALRRSAKGFLAKILIALLVLSFAVWGVSDFVNQVDPSEVARAGDTPVSAAEFSRLYQRQANRIAQQTGRGLTPQQAQSIGLPQQVLQTLVTDALQVDAARKLGLDIGDEALAERIRAQPVFAGSDGSFDRALFDTLLAENRYTEDEYIALQREAAVQEMWANGLVGGLSTPTPYLQAFNRYANQTRQITYMTLTEEVLGPIPDPSEAQLRAFFEENKADFRSPERRTFSYVTLDAETLAEPEAVSAEAVRRAYERDGAYGQPEQRRVQQVLFDDAAAAERAADALRSGTDFAEILAERDRTFEDVDLGLVERSDLVDPAVAEAAFALEEGGVTAVDGRFGPVLVRVSEVREAAKRPLAQVEDEIRQRLAVEDAEELVNDLYVRVEDAVAGGATVGEIAARFDLPARTVSLVSSQGVDPEGRDVDAPQSILSTAFQVAPGADAEPVHMDDTYAWVQTTTVKDAADRPFEEVRGEVLVAWTEAQKTERLADAAADALERVENGVPLDTVAADLGVAAQTTDPFSRREPPQGLPQPVANAAFEGPLGHAGSVIAGEGRHVVFEVTNVSEPAFFEESAELRPIRQNLNDQLANTLLTEFLTAYQADVGATQNPTVINQIVGIEERTR